MYLGASVAGANNRVSIFTILSTSILIPISIFVFILLPFFSHHITSNVQLWIRIQPFPLFCFRRCSSIPHMYPFYLLRKFRSIFLETLEGIPHWWPWWARAPAASLPPITWSHQLPGKLSPQLATFYPSKQKTFLTTNRLLFSANNFLHN